MENSRQRGRLALARIEGNLLFLPSIRNRSRAFPLPVPRPHHLGHFIDGAGRSAGQGLGDEGVNGAAIAGDVEHGPPSGHVIKDFGRNGTSRFG